MVMTRDELAALEEKVREAEASAREMRRNLDEENIKASNAEFAERGIRIGDVVEVISPTYNKSERGIFQGFEMKYSGRPSPRIAKMKKDGTAAVRGRVYTWGNSDVRPVSDQR